MAILVQSNKKPSVSYPSQTGSIITFNSQYAGLPLKSHTIALTATQSGSGTPSPDNVRTINGYSAISVSATGKNLVDISDKTITQGAYVINNVPTKLPSGDYVLSFNFSGNSSSASFRVDDINGTAIFQTSFTTIEGINVRYISLNSEGRFLKLFSNAVGTYSNFQIENGRQATTYEPFGNTYTIQIGSTVYGGEYDARTGVLTVTQPSVQTLQLPPCPIDTLQGVNNIWADTGETTVQYIKIGG